MSLRPPGKVRNLQETLHAKAKGSPGYRFYALYDKVYRADVLEYAYRCCRHKGGAAGVDSERFADIEAYGTQRWLGELAEQLRDKSYRPEAVRRVWIPKPDGCKRPLGIPTVRDRGVQMAAVMVLGPIFEADLQPEQYAYRPGRSALDAVRSVHKLLRTGHTEVVDADLSGYFDEIPHAELTKSVARRVSDGRMLRLIKMWLQAPVEEIDDRGNKHRTTRNRDRGRGCPQGAPISPLLANLYMRRFVLGWKVLGHEQRLEARIVNYADDIVICCRGTGQQAMAAMREMMDRLRLPVNEAKTRLCHVAGRLGSVPGIHHRSVLFGTDGTRVYRHPPVAQGAPAAVPPDQRDDRPRVDVRRGRRSGRSAQPAAGWLVELLPTRTGEQGLSERGQPHAPSAPTVAVRQAQGAGSGNFTLSRAVLVPQAGPGPAHGADTQLSVGERVSPCPKAGCGKSARPV